MSRLAGNDARETVLALEVDLDDVGICLACLSFVSVALERDDERELRRTLGAISPALWAEGLALPVQAALERARRRGMPYADAAIAEVARRGWRALVVQEIVIELARELSRRSRAEPPRVG